MKRLFIAIAVAFVYIVAMAQPARSVLDKTAEALNHKGGITANFTIANEAFGTTTGTIAVKGQMFQATMPQAIIWFDGKTQWAYMRQSEEVNINVPTESEQQMINPYSFITMYKKGFSYSMRTVGNSYEVHLVSTDRSRSVKEMLITVSKSTYVPSKIRMRQGANWSTITITNFKKGNLADSMFKFNAKEYPSAEIIDLR